MQRYLMLKKKFFVVYFETKLICCSLIIDFSKKIKQNEFADKKDISFIFSNGQQILPAWGYFQNFTVLNIIKIRICPKSARTRFVCFILIFLRNDLSSRERYYLRYNVFITVRILLNIFNPEYLIMLLKIHQM